MGDSKELEKKLNENQPVDSLSNVFSSPSAGSRGTLPTDNELLQTVIKLNEMHQHQFSQLSAKYDQLMSMITSDKSTLMGVDTDYTTRVNKIETEVDNELKNPRGTIS
jgi:hypothetical protein